MVRIITMYEDQQPDNWRVQAILMHECHLQQMNNAGCGASALSAYNFHIFHLVNRNQRRISRNAYTHTPPVARSNKSFWICSTTVRRRAYLTSPDTTPAPLARSIFQHLRTAAQQE